MPPPLTCRRHFGQRPMACCIGPDVGSCGTAAYLRKPVFVSDIASDPKWAKFVSIALESGVRASWSSPIMSHDGKLLGTFGMHYREVREPGPSEIQLIEHASRIAGIAIERDRSQTALATAFETIKKPKLNSDKLSTPSLRTIIVLSPEGTILYVNKVVLEYTGCSIEDAMAARLSHQESFIPRICAFGRPAAERVSPRFAF